MVISFQEQQLKIKSVLIAITAVLLAAGCSSLSPSRTGTSAPPTPEQIARSRSAPDSRLIEWGGVIVSLENLRQSSEIQIIAYPLNNSGRPETDEPPVGRFIAIQPGYLESIDYARGRQVTVSGKLDRLREGKVGQSSYLFPVLLVQKIHLWPKQREGGVTPRFNLGIGGGSGGSIRGGLGVGFDF